MYHTAVCGRGGSGEALRGDFESGAVDGLDLAAVDEGVHGLHEVVDGVGDAAHGDGAAQAALIVGGGADVVVDLLGVVHAENGEAGLVVHGGGGAHHIGVGGHGAGAVDGADRLDVGVDQQGVHNGAAGGVGVVPVDLFDDG